jgi:hypothetical protein
MQFYAIVVAGLVALGIGALIAKKIGF